MSNKPKIDWIEAKKTYVATKKISLKDIAKKFGIGYDRVRQVSVEENWPVEKRKRWEEATEQALEETEGSIKELIIRHSKTAKYLQGRTIKLLNGILDTLETDPDEALKMSAVIVRILEIGFKIERELYPKQMQIENDISIEVGISKELKEAVYEVLKKKLRTKKPASKRPKGSK